MSDRLRERLVADKPVTREYPPKVHHAHRLKKLLNQHQVAQLLGVTPLTARRILSGCDLKLSQAFKLAKYLGAAVTDLWQLKEVE